MLPPLHFSAFPTALVALSTAPEALSISSPPDGRPGSLAEAKASPACQGEGGGVGRWSEEKQGIQSRRRSEGGRRESEGDGRRDEEKGRVRSVRGGEWKDA